jgi:hypothetical protein
MIFIITLVTISKYPVLFYNQTVKRNIVDSRADPSGLNVFLHFSTGFLVYLQELHKHSSP